MPLNRDQILAADDLPRETVPVPEWGEGATVIVRTLTGAERGEFEQSLIVEDEDGTKKASLDGMRLKLVALSVIDEEGNRLFTLDDVPALGRKNAKALKRVFDAADRLSTTSPAKVEQLAKN